MNQQIRFLTFAFLALSISTIVNGQTYSFSDFTFKNDGLSDEYEAKYKDSLKIEELASIFNQLNITHVIAPIEITVAYKDEEGYVLAEINYEHNKVFSDYSDYKTHDRNWSRRGTGISVYLQNQIFTALSQYKKSVATQGWTMDRDLLKFESAIKLKKSNGDWVMFYVYNYLDSRGFYPFSFYKNVHLQVGGKTYETETSNTQMTTDKGDIVLDFFAGSGTTAAVAHKMGRKFITTEQMDYINEVTVNRLRSVVNGDSGGISKDVNWKGGGSFVYVELMKQNELYIDKIQAATTKDELLAIWKEMDDSALISYLFDKKTFNERLDAFKTASIEEMKQYLVEVLDKNQLYVNYSEIEDESFGVSEADKKLNHQFYKR